MSNTVSHRKYAAHLAALGVLLALFSARSVYGEGFTNPLGNTTLEGFLLKILAIVTYILFPIIVLLVVYTGFLFVTAQGNPTKLQEARKALGWTVVGAVVVLSAQGIALAVKATVADIAGKP